MSKLVKSVAFQTADPYELALYTHASKNKYFSTYVKRLIARDMEQGNQPKNMDTFYKSALINDNKEEEDED